MVPGYGEELEMGFNATSQCNCKLSPHKYNEKLATGHIDVVHFTSPNICEWPSTDLHTFC